LSTLFGSVFGSVRPGAKTCHQGYRIDRMRIIASCEASNRFAHRLPFSIGTARYGEQCRLYPAVRYYGVAIARGTMKDSRATQRGRILELLIAARGGWIALPKIADCAAQFNSRIFELRHLGFRIKNQTQAVNESRHSWFRLELGPHSPQPAAPAEPLPETISLFEPASVPQRFDPEEGAR
jgi:hypothetical protein